MMIGRLLPLLCLVGDLLKCRIAELNDIANDGIKARAFHGGVGGSEATIPITIGAEERLVDTLSDAVLVRCAAGLNKVGVSAATLCRERDRLFGAAHKEMIHTAMCDDGL